MTNIVGIYFDSNSKVYFFDSNGVHVKKDYKVIVETERGLQLGTVLMCNIKNKEITNNNYKLIRIANQNDQKIHSKNMTDAHKALLKAKDISKKLKLNMNIIDSCYTFDRNQLIFYFLADFRVDFREMAKELASIYKTRIELRQIGVRDKAKEVSGIGQCGRELCCSCFLKNTMESVTINMAKNQNLALNPNKINGQCGRLLCCLNYEDEVYTENRKVIPKVGDEIETEIGIGKVSSVDILSKTYMVTVPNEGKIKCFIGDKCDKCS